MCVHNKNCGFTRTYLPCYIRSEEKVSLTKINSKTRLNKGNTYLFKMLFVIWFISIFHCSTSGIAPHDKRVPGQFLPKENYPPFRVRVWFRFRVRVRVGRQLSSGAIVLEPAKDVDISEDLYRQQLIYRWRSNPEPREKLRLIIFPSLWFFKTPAYNEWNILKEPKYFSLQIF